VDILNSKSLTISCGPGSVPYLREELRQMGYAILSEHERGIEIEATLKDAPRLNLCLRTALHVMFPLKKFPCEGPDELYREVAALPWEDIIDPSEYVSVVSVIDTGRVKNSMFANQKVKDAIVDRLVKKRGKRPSSGPGRDNVVVDLFWNRDNCWLYLDTSGNKLSDRGYRLMPQAAPLRETLAASLLLAAGYDGARPLVNPMCGSGTLAIEAALIALDRAPGLLRDNFGFMHVKNFDKAKMQALRKEIKSRGRSSLQARIIASDRDGRAVDAAKKNARAAGVEAFIEFHVCDFADTPMPVEKGTVILNPAYGVRMGEEAELALLYKSIGDFFKKKCPGYTGYIFTGSLPLAKKVGLRTSRRLIFFNADIECRLLEYKLYE
jgi:putative N6-adenine-specific DNA methylase